MKQQHFLVQCLAIVCTALLLFACNSKKETPAFVENPDMEYRTLGSTGLRVGVIGAFAPCSYVDESGEWAGYEVEVAKMIADSLGAEIEFVEVTSDSRISSIETGKVDICMGNSTRTMARAQKVAFSDNILTLTSTANIFSVNTKGMSAGVYELVMEQGAFSYVAPAGKAVKDRTLKATITIRNDGPQETTPGDINHDGKIDLLDYNIVCQMVRGEIPVTSDGDIDGDGEVNITDVAAIIKLILNS